MRRRNISIILAVPAANALSLANFQSITSVLIPLTCLLTYDSQIPSCTVSDFNNGCSASCVSGLNSIAKSVSSACSDVQVNSNTLLGIVKDGGIVEALCPTLEKTTTQAPKSTISVTIASSTPAAPAAVSVTIPTDGPGVTGGLGLKTSTTSTSRPIAQSTITTTSRAAKTTSTSSTSQSVESAEGGLGGGAPATTSTSTSTHTTSKKTSTASSETTSSPTSQSQGGKSGGGSPFDVTSNDATRDLETSMLALVVAMCAVVVIGR